MGLDMYAYSAHPEDLIEGTKEVSPRLAEGAKAVRLSYWRKHHDLHGWMERLYFGKGGKAESFNCVSVRLDKKDLEILEWDLREGKLPETQGFFFGNNAPTEETIKDDVAFIQSARAALEDGRIVYYDSWW